MKIDRRIFGYTPQGEEVWIYTIESPLGGYIELSSLGATWVSCVVPDQRGILSDVLLGYTSLDGYLQDNSYIGATVGRFANRICKGSFSIADRIYHLELNDGQNSNHSGQAGLNKRLWQGQIEADQVIFSLQDRDKEGGFPGNLSLKITYSFTQDHIVSIDFEGISDQDTILNLTNHAYFNLKTEGSVREHSLKIFSDTILQTTADFIPTGELIPVKGTEFDFSFFKKIGEDIDQDTDQLSWNRGYNHAYIFPPTKNRSLQQAATVKEPSSGREMTLYTTYPCLLFYSAGYLESTFAGKGGVAYRPLDGFCLETQYYPDAPNHPSFPSCLLKKGELYAHRTEYHFTIHLSNS